MARKATSGNGRDRLEDALATLIQNQAAFVNRLEETDRRHVEFERESAERFARIESQMAEIIRVLNDHTRQLERLTDAVREGIGFKGQR